MLTCSCLECVDSMVVMSKVVTDKTVICEDFFTVVGVIIAKIGCTVVSSMLLDHMLVKLDGKIKKSFSSLNFEISDVLSAF